MQIRKADPSGLAARQALIASHFGAGAFQLVRANYVNAAVSNDDIADAFAALWTAERRYANAAVVIPGAPPIDAMGIRMEMWY
jgi:predicted RNase H-like nuclease